MLGRFYTKWGFKDGILNRIGDNRGNPHIGPIQVTLTESNRLVVLAKNKVISVQSFLGTIEFRICPQSDKEKLSRYFFDKAYELLDEGENWRERYLANQQDEAEVENEVPSYYLDIMPVAIAGHVEVPLVAMLDERNCIKVINLDSKSVVTTFGRMGVGLGEMSKPTAIHLFRIGRATLIALGDAGVNQRVTIYDISGSCLLSIGGPGLLPGQFRDISSLAAFLPPITTTTTTQKTTNFPRQGPGQQKDIYDEEYLPDWLKGSEYDEEELVDFLFDASLTSNFVIGQSSDHPNHYWIYYITSTQSIQKLYMIYHETNYGLDGFTVSPQLPHPSTLLLQSTDPTVKKYKTILEVIQAYKHCLQIRKEYRSSCLLAVSDERNFRIQIFRYYWTQSKLYHPEIKYVTSIGGLQNHYLSLSRPMHVSYNPIGGELSICDSSNGHIYLLSSNFLLIKIIHLDYFSIFDIELYTLQQKIQSNDNDNSHNNKDDEMNGDQQQQQQQQQRYKYLLKLQKDRIHNPITIRNDHRKPCSVQFTTLGHMIVGYQSGGIYVYQSNGYSTLGKLSILEVPLFEKIITEYLTYHDIEQLRNTCRFLHHFTRDLRYEYKLFPVERRKIFNKVVYLFLKWARVGQEGTQKIIVAFPTRVQNIASINTTTATDEAEQQQQQTQAKQRKAKFVWDEEVPMTAAIVTTSSQKPNSNNNNNSNTTQSQKKLSNELVPAVTTTTAAHHFSQYQVKMERMEQIFQSRYQLEQRIANDPIGLINNPVESQVILRDCYYHPICKYHLQLLCPLASDRCGDSHLPIVYNRQELQKIQGYLLYDDFYCFLSEIFDVRYIWKYEEYIKELFYFYCYEQELFIRTDPMSRQNEVIRPTILMKTRTLSYLGYLEIILLLEENLHGYKSIVEHKLFTANGRGRHIPRKAVVVANKDSPTLVSDPIQQYEPANIPFPPLKSLIGKKALTKPGMENVIRQNSDPVQEHLEVFQFQAEKASQFINKLFS